MSSDVVTSSVEPTNLRGLLWHLLERTRSEEFCWVDSIALGQLIGSLSSGPAV